MPRRAAQPCVAHEIPALVSIFEMADMAMVSKPTIIAWRYRYSDFPLPVAELRCGPIFLQSDMLAWIHNHNDLISKPKRAVQRRKKKT